MAVNLTGKRCCTCGYWTGKRSVVGGGRSVLVDSSNDSAACSLPGANRNNKFLASRTACNKYEKVTGYNG